MGGGVAALPSPTRPERNHTAAGAARRKACLAPQRRRDLATPARPTAEPLSPSPGERRKARGARGAKGFFGPAESAFSIGYKVTPGGATHRGGVRHITDLDLFEISAVLHGANRYATLLSVKGAAPVLETKATSSVITPRRRAGTSVVCSVCGRPAAVRSGGLRRGERLICRHCVEEAAEGATTDTATIDADDLADAYQGLADVELTSSPTRGPIRWRSSPSRLGVNRRGRHLWRFLRVTCRPPSCVAAR